tara:strand:- start:42 stop:1559 length:1518 start_codon:yes stop_codon:yes gene_type:complete
MNICRKNQQKLCGNKECQICFIRSFASYEGTTENGKLKVECWDYDMNNGLTPYNITLCYDYNAFFKCDICLHSFSSRVYDITRNDSKGERWCSYCSTQPKKLCDNKDCKICFDRSFASCELKTNNGKLKIECWDNTLNNNILPRDIFKSSGKKFSFKCDICLHNFTIIISDITSKNRRWCPYCVNKKLCNDLNCNFCFKNSFSSYTGITLNNKLKIECWDNVLNNNIKPRDIFKSSGKKFSFKCDICLHNFTIIISDITSKNREWCPYCSHHKLCDDNNCKFCFINSFASYEGRTFNNKLKVECWNNELNNNILPRDIFKYTNKKYSFLCDICNTNFQSVLGSITFQNQWCPVCKNKTEKKLLKWLKDNFKYKIKFQAKFDWCKNSDTNKYLPFDFCIEELKLIIEPDGMQHFKQIMNWQTPEKRLEIDKYKIRQALSNGYSIIRILQVDIYNDKNNWEIKTKNVIKYYEIPTQICIGDEILYDKYNNIIKDIESEETIMIEEIE